MRQQRPFGSVRGAVSNDRSGCDPIFCYWLGKEIIVWYVEEHFKTPTDAVNFRGLRKFLKISKSGR